MIKEDAVVIGEDRRQDRQRKVFDGREVLKVLRYASTESCQLEVRRRQVD